MIPRKRSYLFRRAFGGFFSWFKPKQWSNYEELKDDSVFLLRLLRRTLSRDPETGRRKKRKQYDDFSEYMVRERLSENKVDYLAKQLFLYAVLYGSLSLLVLGYSFFLFRKPLYIAGVITVLMSIMLALQGVQQSIIMMRFKHRTLDIGFSRWLRLLFSRSI